MSLKASENQFEIFKSYRVYLTKSNWASKEGCSNGEKRKKNIRSGEDIQTRRRKVKREQVAHAYLMTLSLQLNTSTKHKHAMESFW